MSVLERVRRAERFDDEGVEGLEGLMDERLREVKRQYDPEGLFRDNFAVGTATAAEDEAA